MSEVLIDTDILSYFFRGDPKVVKHFENYLEQFDQVNISIITYYEILAGLSYKKATRQINEFKVFVNSSNLIYISEDSVKFSAEIYSDLRTKGISIGTSDILIAGISIENDLVLITNNEKHFCTN